VALTADGNNSASGGVVAALATYLIVRVFVSRHAALPLALGIWAACYWGMRRPFQFSVVTMFWLVAIVAMWCLGLRTQLGLAGSVEWLVVSIVVLAIAAVVAIVNRHA
jgi:hypothetical protein